VALEGFPGEPTLAYFTGIVLHSDTPLTGTFECSNPLINQLHRNIVWGKKATLWMCPLIAPNVMNAWAGPATPRSSSAPPALT
jgi:alpha-L-rhamnosidase